MHHDGTGNSCARDGYIMSPSRGTNGEASWSTCSARVAAELRYNYYLFHSLDFRGSLKNVFLSSKLEIHNKASVLNRSN